MSSVSHRPLRTPAPATALAVIAVILLPGVIGLALALAPSGALAAPLAFGAGAALAVTGMASRYPHDRPGWCNTVTMLRLAMTSALVAAAVAPGGGWAVFAVAVLALTLDGVDGHLARRQGLASAFGARFDMEVDAALGAVLALILLARGTAGPELLVLGFARYAFIAAGFLLPWLNAELKDSFRRKLVCVVQIGALAALTIPVLPEGPARIFGLAAAALLAWSFARDIRWLAHRR